MVKQIYMCCGSDCKERNRVRKDVRARLIELGVEKKEIDKVGCQKICKGPVFGVELDGRLEWFASLEPDDADRLAIVARGGAVDRALWKKRVKKRAGKLRR